MNKEIKNKMVPKLRFPEFKDGKKWVADEFSKFIALYRGSSPRPIQNYFTKDSTGVNWIKIGDTKSANNFIISQVEEKITPEGAQKSREVTVGELILANSMSFGKTYKLAIDGFIYDGWFVLREYENFFNKQFLLQLLNSDYMQSQYIKFSAGGIVQNINSDIVYKTLLFHTALPEQQKIANCLSSLDDIITAESQKLEEFKAHKKGLMQQLFPAEGETVPKLRFAEFRDSGEWEEVALKKITHNVMVGIASAATQAYRKSGVILFRNQNIKDGYLDDKDILFIDEKYEEAHKNKRLKAGDLLIARTGYPGAARVVPKKYEGAQSFTTLIARPNNKLIDSTFLCLYINSELGKAFFEATKIGGGQQNVNAGSLVEMPIPNPSINEQQKIADCLSSLDELITAQTEKIAQLKLHKKGLMQGLFPSLNNQ